jgi:hypothetical protein
MPRGKCALCDLEKDLKLSQLHSGATSSRLEACIFMSCSEN